MKNIGIIGGMGPMASVDLFAKITALTMAESDQEHLHVLIDSNPAIPDRTKAILEGGIDPVPELVRSAHNLESLNAEIILMACNTAHYFFDEVQRSVHADMINMIEETALEVKRRNLSRVGLLATSGTYRTGLYEKFFDKHHITIVRPPRELEANIMDLIYHGVKAGKKEYPLAAIQEVLANMRLQGIDTFILGCTELPLAFQQYHIEANVIDPTEVLARRAIQAAGKRIHSRLEN